MKKKRLFLILLLCLFSVLPVVMAEDIIEDDVDEWGDKLGRGVVNVLTSPLEVVRTVDVKTKTDGALTGFTVGLVEGIGRFVVRAGVGVIDVVTFPFEFPKEHRAPLIEPEFVWVDWN